MVLDYPIEDWPKVDVLISFYSTGFPLDKAIKYADKYKPIQINDLENQKVLWDRRKIYTILKEYNIPVAKHFFVNRSNEQAIVQEYLEKQSKLSKNRGEYLIQFATKMREQFDNNNVSL